MFNRRSVAFSLGPPREVVICSPHTTSARSELQAFSQQCGGSASFALNTFTSFWRFFGSGSAWSEHLSLHARNADTFTRVRISRAAVPAIPCIWVSLFHGREPSGPGHRPRCQSGSWFVRSRTVCCIQTSRGLAVQPAKCTPVHNIDGALAFDYSSSCRRPHRGFNLQSQ